MLDYLCFRINCPIYIFSAEYSIRSANEIGVPLRILDDSDFSEAFMESRKLILGNPTFLRALGWFRKGKNSPDPFDKYLAYWNAIEIVASKYNPNKERCQKKGSICSIWECFKTVWGDCDQWPVIGGQVNWIDTSNRNRVDIAHGVMPIEIEQVKRIVNSLGNLEEVCHNFLVSWFPLLSSEVPHDLIE